MSRFLLVGLDGLEPSLVERWMDEGRLPHLASLRDAGSFMPLASTVPPATFPAWTSCATGVNPGRHGIIDFTEMVHGEYAIRFINSTFRKVPAIWKTLSEAGKRVGVLGVPATYPPEELNGFMVSGFDSPVCTRIDKSFVYPESLYEDVKDWRFADFQETNIGLDWHDKALPKLIEGIGIKERIATKLLKREAWDFFMLVFGESDTVAHHFWMFHDPDSPRHRPGKEDAIAQVYERLDVALGKLIETAGEGVTVGVVSDHGFGGAGTGIVHINNWLAEQGLLSFSNANSSFLKKLALTCVPPSLHGTLFRRFRSMAAKAESGSRFGGIDWSATKAWSEELNYFPSVRVNLKGREPDGVVEPNNYDEFCDKLCLKLEKWTPIAKAWRRGDVYSGKYASSAPDIILELAMEDGYSHSCLRSRGGPSFRRLREDEYLGGKERGMNGNHRPNGCLFLSKPVSKAQARIEDIAPTVAACLGVQVPPMDGTSLLTSEDKGLQPLASDKEETPYSREEEQAIEERLKRLGYF